MVSPKQQPISLVRRSLTIVLPAFNEEANIARAVDQAAEVAPKFADEWEIVVVDDGSQDRTAEVLEACKRTIPNLRIIQHPRNQGYGAALKSGISSAKKDLIFFCDSDLQFNLNELGNLIRWIGQYDVVIGYRKRRVDPVYRRLNAFGWNLLVRLLLGLHVKDIDCAFKLFRREVFDKVRIDAVGAMVNTDILAQAYKFGFLIHQVPVTHYPRKNGEPSGANLAVILKAFRELFRLYNKLREMRKHPRVAANVKWRVPDFSDGWTEQTVDLSEGGIRFVTEKTCGLGERLTMEILDSEIGSIVLSGSVLRLIESERGYEVAVRFRSMGRRQRESIRRLIALRGRPASSTFRLDPAFGQKSF